MITQTTTSTAPIWRDSLPTLWGLTVSLREIDVTDAPSLFELITSPEVTKFISPPPKTVDAFEQYIKWAHDERQRGRHVCYAIVPHGMDTAVGLFHVRRLDLGFDTAEWGFALGSAFWGTGVFLESAELLLEFVFELMGVTRLEARVAMPNGRGHGALRKIGAVQEAVLRRSFPLDGRCIDQALWAIVDTDYQERRRAPVRRIYVH